MNFKDAILDATVAGPLLIALAACGGGFPAVR